MEETEGLGAGGAGAGRGRRGGVGAGGWCTPGPRGRSESAGLPAAPGAQSRRGGARRRRLYSGLAHEQPK